jgi:hypothetical protein
VSFLLRDQSSRFGQQHSWLTIGSYSKLVSIPVICFLRYNNRKMDDAGRFHAVLRQVVDKRLTYDELIGKAAMEKQGQEFSQEFQT